jgi:AcrR family transcriptional regulator
MASNKNTDGSRKRPYTLRARARRKEEVHLRITKATVHLHGTVGPARTTVSDIANIAGVRRATVYNHFPTDLELLDACSTHWFTENPPPDFAPWVDIKDPISRAVVALTAMYEYYDHGREMLEKVLRDAPLVPALDEILRQKWWPMMDGIIEILADGWDSMEAERSSKGAVPVRATFRVALDFFTWQALAESRLTNEEAARLGAVWVEASLMALPE